MSRTIDERVVSMQFDNKHFESNVQTSLTTLDKLKKALKLDNASKGLQDVGAAAKKCNLAPLGDSAHMVGLKFNALYSMADQAFRNIYNSAERYAKKIASAFTIDPIKTGFEEYETQLNAVQTILANTQHSGTTLDDVNAALDELNTYADKTIYNFTQMTRNIGTFTAAGVSLDASVRAIQGIANLAAVSGSNSQQASTAMYQLSQALAAGRVSLMDWNSVVNAGMGGKVFQDALIRTSELLGTGAKEAIETYGTFRESLTQGQWLTTEVLTETLAQLSGAYSEADLIAQGYSESQAKEIANLAETAVNAATKVKTFTQLMDTLKESAQSGWTQSWEYIIGDFEQAKSMWTSVSDELGGIIGRSADKRNRLLEGALTSKWDQMVKKINEAGISTDTFEEKLRTSMKNAGYDVDAYLKKYGTFEKAFQSGTVKVQVLGNALNGLSESVESVDLSSITEGLKFGGTGEAVKQLQTALQKLGYELPKYGIDGLFKAETEAAVKAFQEAQGLEVTGIVDEKTLDALKKATSETKNLSAEIKDLMSGITELGGRQLLMKAFGNLYKAVSTPIKFIGKAWRETFEAMKPEQLYSMIQGFEKFTSNLILSEENADKLRRTFKGLFAVLEIVTSFVGGGIKLAFKGLNTILEHFDLNILDVTASIGDAIVKFRDWLFENNVLAKGFDKFAAGVAKGIVLVRDWIKAFWALPEVQAKVQQFKNTFSGAFDGIKKHFKGTGERFKEFIERVKQMDSISIGAIFKDFKANVFDYFVNIDFGKIIENVKEKFKNFVEAMKSFFSKIGDSVEGGKEKITSFFGAIKKFLGDNMGTIIALGSLIVFIRTLYKIKEAIELLSRPMDILDDFFDIIGKSVKKIASAIYIKNLATSIFMIAGAVAILAMLPQGKVWSSVGAIVAIGAGLAILSKTMAKVDTKDMAKLSTSLLSLGAAILMMAAAAKILGGMSGGDLAKGGMAVAGFLGLIIGLAAVAKSISTDVSSFGRMMVKLSASLLIFALAIKIFANMDGDTLLKGGAVVLGFLGVMTLMMKYTSTIGKSSANFGRMMLSMSTGLILMSYAIKILGKMDTKELIQGGAAVTIFMGVMTLMMKYSKGSSIWAGEFGKMMTGVGASLLMMAAAIKILGGMEIRDLVKGGIVIGLLMGLMGSMMILAKDMSRKSAYLSKFGIMMMGFGAAMLLVTGSILLLAMVNEDDLKKATLVVGAVGILFGALLAITKNSTSAIKVGTIIGLSVAIGVLAAAVAALAFIPEKDLYRATGCMTVLVGALSLLMLSVKNLKMDWKSFAGIAGMTLAVAGIAVIVKLLADNIKDPDGALKSAIAISSIIIALSGAAALLSVASKYAPTSKNGALALTGIVLGVAAIGIGLTEYALARLPYVGEQLSSFMEKLSGFIAGAKDLKADSFAGIKTLVETMSILAGASFKYAATNFFFGGSAYEGINTFKSFIETVVPVVKELAVELSDANVQIDIEKVNSVIGIVKTLAEAAALAPSINVGLAGGGWKGGGFGAIGVSVPLLKQFTQFIKDVAPELKTLAKDISGISNFNSENIKTVVEAVGTLANAAASAPSFNITAAGAKMGAFASISIPNLSGFATFISRASMAMKVFIYGLEGKEINAEAVTAICEGVATLAEAAANLPGTTIAAGFGKGKGILGIGGAISWPAFRAFGEFINVSMKAVTDFTEKIGSKDCKIDESKLKMLTPICEAVEILARAAGNIPSATVLGGIGGGFGKLKSAGIAFGAGGGASWPAFDSTLKWFEAVVPKIQGFAISDLGSKVKPVNAEALVSVCKAVESLGIAAGHIPTDKSLQVTAAGLGLSLNGSVAGVGGGYLDGEYIETSNLEAAQKWFAEVVPLMQGFTLSIGESGITSAHAETLLSVCEGVEILAAAAGQIPSNKKGKLSGWFAGIAGGGWGIGGLGGSIKGDYIETSLLTETLSWFEKVVPIMQSAAISIGESGIKTEHAETFASVCNGIKILAGAASDAPTETDFDNLTKVFGIVTIHESGTISSQLTETAEWYNAVLPATEFMIVSLKQDGVEAVDISNFQSVCDAISTLSKAAINIPTSTEWSESVFGSAKVSEYVSGADFDGFLDWLQGNGSEGGKSITTALESMKTELESMNFTTVDAGKLITLGTAMDSLTTAAAKIPTKEKIDGVFKDKVSSADFTAFTDWFKGLGAAIDQFNTDVGTVDAKQVNAVAEAVANITAAAGNLFDSNSTYIFSELSGDKGSTLLSDYESALDNLSSLIEGFYETAKNFGDGDLDTLSTVSTAIKNVSTTLKTLSEITSESINVEDATFIISSAITAINTACSTEIDTSGIDNVKAGIDDITEVINTINSLSDKYGSIDDLRDAVNTLKGIKFSELSSVFQNGEGGGGGGGSPESVTSNITSIANTISGLSGMNFTSAQSFADALGKLANTSINNIVTNFNNGTSKVTSAASSMVTKAAATASSKGSLFYSAGSSAVSGFCNGISANTYRAEARAAAMAEAAYEAAKEKLQINSPSKLFIPLGGGIPEGLAKGIDKMGWIVSRSSESMADTAFTGTQNALSRIASAIDSDIDVQPTIRPVVDLTDVRSGARSINGMFGMEPSVRTIANLDSINGRMNARQNGLNDDVVSAIDRLGKSLGNMSGDTYRIGDITYDDGSNVADAVKILTRAAKVGRRK